MNTEKRSASDLAVTYESQIGGKVVLTTGVSPGGLGAAFVDGIALARPSMLILAGRNPTKLQQTVQDLASKYPEVKVRTLELDLVSLAAVRSAAQTVNGWADVPQIDVLVNNAAVMAIDWAASPEGYDSQLAINHLGPFLLRISSWDGKSYHKWLSYGQSKTANMLMAISLAEKHGSSHNLSAFSVNPGLVSTNLGGHLKLYGESDADLASMLEIDRIMGNAVGFTNFESVVAVPPEVGANTHIYAAFDPEISAHNGAYLQSCRISDPWTDTMRPWATSSFEAERLCKLSEKIVGQEFS